MTEAEEKSLREEFLAKARGNAKLVEGSTEQYWKFLRHEGHNDGPLLYIGKTRRVIHLKNVVMADPRWTFIPKSDPKNVGAVYEIRLEGTVADVRAAFNAGFATLVATP